MTQGEIDDRIDAMAQAAGESLDLMPGLITINADEWCKDLAEFRAPCSALHDGMRHRSVMVHVASTFETAILSRSEAGERGAPYRDLTPRS